MECCGREVMEDNMSICRGCGGFLGRDCFNEPECMFIEHSQQSAMVYENQDLRRRVERLERLLGIEQVKSPSVTPLQDSTIPF